MHILIYTLCNITKITQRKNTSIVQTLNPIVNYMSMYMPFQNHKNN